MKNKEISVWLEYPWNMVLLIFLYKLYEVPCHSNLHSLYSSLSAKRLNQLKSLSAKALDIVVSTPQSLTLSNSWIQNAGKK